MTQASAYELPQDRLATMDEQGHRVFLHPADVKGKYHSWRKIVHNVLLVVFLVLPWIQINGQQALLLDVAKRRFAIFGLAFWAHDTPMLIFVATGTLFGISLVTAVLGRVWCGWSCPETVFVETVYRQIERLIEGNAVERRRLQAAPWGPKKLGLRALKWGAFLAVSLIITHSFLAYFVGTETLAQMMRHKPAENPGTFAFMAISTGIILFFFGWFREQFCIIMCPYGRFQSVLLDENSMVVAYDSQRGEPRRGSTMVKEDAPGETALKQQGDCINCYRCVQVCPTGIDIRRGLQLECIACTACIDACDEVMHNIKKPAGLIRYTTENGLNGKANRHIRPRVILLSLVTMGIGVGLVYTLLTRPPIKATVFNAKSTPYQMLQSNQKDAMLTNQFYVVASNYTFDDGEIQFKTNNPEVKIITQVNPVNLSAGEEKKIGIFLEFPKHVLKMGKARIKMDLETRAHNQRWQRVLTQEVPLVGPF